MIQVQRDERDSPRGPSPGRIRGTVDRRSRRRCRGRRSRRCVATSPARRWRSARDSGGAAHVRDATSSRAWRSGTCGDPRDRRRHDATTAEFRRRNPRASTFAFRVLVCSKAGTVGGRADTSPCFRASACPGRAGYEEAFQRGRFPETRRRRSGPGCRA